MLNRFHKPTLIISLMFLAACASAPKVSKLPDDADPAAEIEKLRSDLTSARDEQVNVLAKNDYRKAQKQLNKAVKERNDGDDNEDVLEEVAEGNAWLAQAKQKANLADETLSEVTDVRERAIARGAALYAGKELKVADRKLYSAAKDYKDVSDKEKKDLLNDYLAIELLAARNSAVATAKKNVKQAEQEDAEEYAPLTLNTVKKNIVELENYVTSKRDDITGIENLKQNLDKRSVFLLKITREAKRANNKSAEQLAIEDSIHQNEKQRLTQELATTESNLEGTATALTATQGTLAATQGTNKRLMSEVEIKQKYQETKDKFADSEADVFLEGNNILIRLKGLHFSSGKADLTAKNADLLAKVENAIQEIGGASIVVEGHTDSIGAKDLNEKLSVARAETIEDYLVTKGTITDDKIEAEGHGDAKPLASNKTKEGRAQNRRVDVIISPE